MRVNYEEKTFEMFFNMEISSKINTYFPIGQRLEGYLAVDFFCLFNNVVLSKSITGYPFWLNYYKGVNLEEISQICKDFQPAKEIPDLDNIYARLINKLPAMKSNVFFQYKKPEYMKTGNASEWREWGRKYYQKS